MYYPARFLRRCNYAEGNGSGVLEGGFGLLSISGQVPDNVPVELQLPDGTKQLYLHGSSFEF